MRIQPSAREAQMHRFSWDPLVGRLSSNVKTEKAPEVHHLTSLRSVEGDGRRMELLLRPVYPNASGAAFSPAAARSGFFQEAAS